MVLLTPDQLRELIASAVRDGIGNTNGDREVMTLDEVAKWLRVTPRALRNWAKNDGLPALRVGAEYRFQRGAVVAWLERRAEKPGAHVSKHVERLSQAK